MDYYINNTPQVNKNPWIPDDYNNRDIFVPEEVIDQDYIMQQVLYRHKLLLDANGEHFQLWQKKRTGHKCNNPTCPAHDSFKNAPQEDCPVCLGTGFIGGYDNLGEILVSVAPTTEVIAFNLGGKVIATSYQTWTMPEPKMWPGDVLLALDRDQVINEKMKYDVEMIRRPDNFADYDPFPDIGVTRIIKIANLANNVDAYVQDIDYKISNEGVLWISNRRPGDFESYFITYEIAKPYSRFYMLKDINPNYWRGQYMVQRLTMDELEIGHYLYDLINVSTPYTSRYPDRFPLDYPWYQRDISDGGTFTV